MDNQREFLGIWIPREIWLAKDLTIFEKVIYSEICSLDGENGCAKNNEYFANFTGASQWTVSNAITHLKKKGLIKQVAFDGKTRILKAVKLEIRTVNNEHSENHKADFGKSQGRLVKITRQTSENHKAENNDENLKSLENIKGFSDLSKTESPDFFEEFSKIKERKEENKKEEKEKNEKEKTEKEKGTKEKVKKEKVKKEKEERNKEEKQESDNNSFSPLLAKGGIDKGGTEKTPKTYVATLNDLPALLENEPIELRETLIEFVKMRKAIKKPLTAYALKLALAKMHSLGADDIITMKAIVEQSIENSWQGLFALRVDKNNGQNPRGEFNRNLGAVEKRERILNLLKEKENN